MKKILLKNGIMFTYGFCIYITIEVLFRTYSYPLMGMVGGVALILLDKINNYISWDMQLLYQMIIGGFIVTMLELLSGEFALHIMGVRMWDYSNMWMPMFDNLICPLFSFFWVLLSGVGIVLADAIDYYVLHDDIQPYYRVGSKKFVLPKRTCTV